MAQRPHRVEEMRHGSNPAVEGDLGLLGGRVGVPARDRDTSQLQELDQDIGARQFRGERDEANRACPDQALEQADIRVATPGGRVCTEPGRRKERALEVYAEDARAVIRLWDLAQRREQVLLRRGDERRQVRRHAALEHGVAGLAETLRVGFEQIDTPEAVHLEVDESGCRNSAAVRRGEPVCRDRAVRDLDVARNQAPLNQGRRDAQPHSRASRTFPAARSSRSRAESASMPASRETIATFALPWAAASAPSTSWSEAPVASCTARRARARSFSFVAATSTFKSP